MSYTCHQTAEAAQLTVNYSKNVLPRLTILVMQMAEVLIERQQHQPVTRTNLHMNGLNH